MRFHAPALPETISTKLRPELDAVIDQAVASGRIVGANVAIALDGKLIYERHAGMADRERGVAVSPDTLFRLASMTKPLVSAAALALIEQGALALDLPVRELLPYFRPRQPDGAEADIRIRHLLSHTAGLRYGFGLPDNQPYRAASVSDGLDLSVLSLEENLRRLSSQALLFEPGASWAYSLAADVLGGALEALCGENLECIVSRHVTGPLGMLDTRFRIDEPARLAKPYADNEQTGEPARPMRDSEWLSLPGAGAIHYQPARAFHPDAYLSGGCGMLGNARDYLRFLEAVRQGGAPILSAESAGLMTRDAVAHLAETDVGPGMGFGLGFSVLRDPEAAGAPQAVGTFGWGGVYGNSFFVDPAARLSVVMLSNTALEGLFGDYPRQLAAAIYRQLA